jgi:hypothetical protein
LSVNHQSLCRGSRVLCGRVADDPLRLWWLRSMTAKTGSLLLFLYLYRFRSCSEASFILLPPAASVHCGGRAAAGGSVELLLLIPLAVC